MVTFYDLKAERPGNRTFSFADEAKGKVVLVVNTASHCGFTPQLEGLESLYKQYKDQGLLIVGFPSNEFGFQTPGNDEKFGEFCQVNYGVTFPMMKKSNVNGGKANDTFKYLKAQKKNMFGTGTIVWNFSKFLIDRDGKVVERYSPKTEPTAIEPKIKELLAQGAPAAQPTPTASAAAPAPASTA
ncbi:Glutathione peroxidase 2 [Tilletia horrida]|nr:Glutathione peroxidase 2 [Tilletia horrida]KAK0567253.1 Glutathione peroxidase 2 [Tilletia horrida]